MALAIYSAIFYSTLYAFFAGFGESSIAAPQFLIPNLFDSSAIVYEEGHGFTVSQNGLTFVGVGVGVTIGACLSPVQKMLYVKHGQKFPGPGGSVQPEARMILAMPAAVMLPVGIFWFAW